MRIMKFKVPFGEINDLGFKSYQRLMHGTYTDAMSHLIYLTRLRKKIS